MLGFMFLRQGFQDMKESDADWGLDLTLNLSLQRQEGWQGKSSHQTAHTPFDVTIFHVILLAFAASNRDTRISSQLRYTAITRLPDLDGHSSGKDCLPVSVRHAACECADVLVHYPFPDSQSHSLE